MAADPGEDAGPDSVDRPDDPTGGSLGLDDPRELALDDLRRTRNDLQLADDAVSYARRIAQARLDLVEAEQRRRPSEVTTPDAGATTEVGALRDELRTVLSRHLTGGPARPPRPAEDLSDHPLAIELDAVCSRHGFARLDSLDAHELTALRDALVAFETDVSARRRALFERLDAHSAELVRRYRDGHATSVTGHSDTVQPETH